MSICIDTRPALDRQTDREKCHNNIALCMHCLLTRDKAYQFNTPKPETFEAYGRCASKRLDRLRSLQWGGVRLRNTSVFNIKI